MPKLKAPDNCEGCSHDGQEYPVDDKGFIEVPDEAVTPLLDHGFTTVPSKAGKAAPAAQ